MGYYGFQWRPYVSVAERRRLAEKEMNALRKKGHTPRPIRIEGRAIATSAWGGAWCDHLESFSDYDNRLPRGRTYARNGSVVDLQIAAGKVSALVMGSELYRIAVTIHALPAARWKALVADTSGRIDSVLGLLRGRLDAAVMARMCDRQRGLFPSPSEIEMKCSCPDWAGMCKHVAATLYGVGARLDSEPELLFLLRGVDHTELISAGAATLAQTAAQTSSGADDEAALGALFGIELGGVTDGDEAAAPVAPASASAPARSIKKPAAKGSAPINDRRPPSTKRAGKRAETSPSPVIAARSRKQAARVDVRLPVAAKTARKRKRSPAPSVDLDAIIAAALAKAGRER